MTPKRLIEHYGTAANVARAMGVKPASVSAWISHDSVPIDRQCQAEVITGGRLKADRALLKAIADRACID